MRNGTKRTIAITATVAALAGAGVAFAAWTTNGSGTGSATAGSAQDLTITQTGSATGLFPTGSVNATFTVTNPNPYKVALTQATITDVATTKAGCNASSVTGANVDLNGITV